MHGFSPSQRIRNVRLLCVDPLICQLVGYRVDKWAYQDRQATLTGGLLNFRRAGRESIVANDSIMDKSQLKEEKIIEMILETKKVARRK